MCAIQDPEGGEDDLYGELDELAHDFSSLSTEAPSNFVYLEDAKEMITYDLGEDGTFEQKKIDYVIGACVEGKVSIIDDYRRTSSDAAVFLHGRDEKGNTTLIMAACEASLGMVSLLLDRGSDVSATNHNGRTALMEAALWGRVSNVELLNLGGANSSMLDLEKRSASDLTEPIPKNREERDVHAGGSIGYPQNAPIYQEDTSQRDADRRRIARLPSPHEAHSSLQYGRPPTGGNLEHYSFKRFTEGESHVVFRGPCSVLPIATPQKSVARLERGRRYPAISAMSGWAHPELRSVRVGGIDWTKEVMYIASVVEHRLDKSDFGKPGQHYACHAEKQLVAYFVDRHCFLPRDGIYDQRLEESIEKLDHDMSDDP